MPKKKYLLLLLLILSLIIIFNCDPLVNSFESKTDFETYKAKIYQDPPQTIETLSFMTWNIRFGVGRTDWFGDCCGSRVIIPENEVKDNLQKIANFINETKPDILFLQEVDIESKRTGYIDQVKWLLNNTYFNYGIYASMWEAQYVPSDGLGRMNTGNAILSRWKIKNPERIQLPLREDQDALTKYFYLRRNLLKTKIELPGIDNFYALCLHMSAFCTDDTKQNQIEKVIQKLDELNNDIFVLGGDFNLIPPGSDSIDFCGEDQCSDENFHQGSPDSDTYHKEGSYFGLEIDLLQPLYDNYNPAVPLSSYLGDQLKYFTHSTDWNDGFWNRKLDYIFSNQIWIPNTDSTYQQATLNNRLSDHVPVSVKWEVQK